MQDEETFLGCGAWQASLTELELTRARRGFSPSALLIFGADLC